MRDDLKDGVPIPSDAEIKNLICVLPNDYLHKIHVGPTGERFKQLCNEAMTRIGAKERKNRPATMYRVATGILENLQPHEIGQDLTPYDPAHRSKK
jgi:hypothetical protein